MAELKPSNSFVNEERLKEILKSAIVEVLEKRKDLLHDLLAEAIEDIALSRAIEECEQSKTILSDNVFDVLDGNH